MCSKGKNAVFNIFFIAFYGRFFVDGMLIPKNHPQVLINILHIASAKGIIANISPGKAIFGINRLARNGRIRIIPIVL